MLDEILKTAKEIYGARKTDDCYCSFCKSYIGNGYCNCIDSQQINRIAKRINEKAYLEERIRVLNLVYNPNEHSNVPLKYAHAKLEDYKVRNIKERSIFDSVKAYQENIIRNWLTGENLLLIGNYGTAKSFLKSALCNYCTNKKRMSAKYINVTELADEVKATFSDGTPKTESDIIKSYVNFDYLFIDDLDKEKPTKFIKTLLYKVINRRYEDLKPTVISSNADIEDLDENYLGEATVSRLLEKSVTVYFDIENERLNTA